MKRNMDRSSRSSSIRKDSVRHVTISSSSSSRSRSRSRSLSSLSRNGRRRNRSESRHRSKRHRRSRRRRHSSSSRSKSNSRSRSKSKSRKSRSLSTSKQDSSKHASSSGYLGTNSRDPKMVASRIFIGNLPMTDVGKDDLDAIYGRYGKILGITVRPGFGFIQFEQEQDAQNAVAGERGSSLKGFLLDVKMATDTRNRASGKPEDERELSPTWKGREPVGYVPPRPPMPTPGLPGYRMPIGMPMHGPPIPSAFFGPPIPGPFPRGPLPPPDHFRRNPFSEPFHGEPFPPDFPHVPHRHPLPSPHLGPIARPPPVPSPPSVDCEILVVEGKPRLYAESIKKRLMASGILTVMNVVMDMDVPIALEDASRRRLLFAVVVNDQNEARRSITVNILHGIPQEHRNMPLDDAMPLITRSYDKYMLERKERLSATVPTHPENFLPPGPRVQYLLNLLADHRFLTIVELTAIMDYLDERRRLLITQDKNRLLHPLDREVEQRKQEGSMSDIADTRRRMDVDERDRGGPDDIHRDRITKSVDVNRERLALADLNRDRIALSAEINRERMALADLNRDRMTQSLDLNRERMALSDSSRDRISQTSDHSRDRVSLEGVRDRYSTEDSNKKSTDMSRERLIQAEVARSGALESRRTVNYEGSPPSASSSGQGPDMSIAKILSTSINFDSPSVKQALDNLMSGGPSIFKNVSDTVGMKGSGANYSEDARF